MAFKNVGCRMSKNRLLSFIFAIGIGLLSIFSFLIPKNNTDIVYADENEISSSFNGSNLEFFVRYSDNSTFSFVSVSFSFITNQFATPKQQIILTANELLNSIYSFNNFSFSKSFTFVMSGVYSVDGYDYFIPNNQLFYDVPRLTNGVADGSYLRFYQFMTAPTGNVTLPGGSGLGIVNFDSFTIYKVEIGNNVDNSNLPKFTNNNINVYYNYIAYTNTDEMTYYFCFPVINASSFDLNTIHGERLYNVRTYYLEYALNDSSNVQWNKGYETGFSEGKTNGQTIGYNQGYSVGFNEGVTSANDYSFLGFFGAIFDAPINAFNSLFSFELFGVDMRSLILGLLTLCIIILIVRYLTGGK